MAAGTFSQTDPYHYSLHPPRLTENPGVTCTLAGSNLCKAASGKMARLSLKMNSCISHMIGLALTSANWIASGTLPLKAIWSGSGISYGESVKMTHRPFW